MDFFSWTNYCALSRIFTDNRTLGGVVDNAEITERRMRPPVKKYNRDKWEVCLKLRATVNRRVYASNWYLFYDAARCMRQQQCKE